jgi:hypothetical protein
MTLSGYSQCAAVNTKSDGVVVVVVVVLGSKEANIMTK